MAQNRIYNRVNMTIPPSVLKDLDRLAETEVRGNRSLMVQLLVRRAIAEGNKSRKKTNQPT